jgi:hypothetical protein
MTLEEPLDDEPESPPKQTEELGENIEFFEDRGSPNPDPAVMPIAVTGPPLGELRPHSYA